MGNRIKAVAFDMDGLMFDTEDVYWKAAHALLGRRGYPYTPELCAEIMGRPPQYCFERFIEVYHLPETWRELEKESEELFLGFLQEGYSAMPGLFELLDKIESKGIPKAVCTSSSRRVLEAVLTPHRLLPRFAFIMTAGAVTRGKPAPDIYFAAAERFGVEPSEMLVLEDSAAGCRAAQGAGAPCYAVRAVHNKDADLSAASHIAARLDDRSILNLFEEETDRRG